MVFALLIAMIGISTARGDKPAATEAWIDAEFPGLVELYHWFHQNPELSFQEEQTAAKLAELWRADGFEVTTKRGRPWNRRSIVQW